MKMSRENLDAIVVIVGVVLICSAAGLFGLPWIYSLAAILLSSGIVLVAVAIYDLKKKDSKETKSNANILTTERYKRV